MSAAELDDRVGRERAELRAPALPVDVPRCAVCTSASAAPLCHRCGPLLRAELRRRP